MFLNWLYYIKHKKNVEFFMAKKIDLFIYIDDIQKFSNKSIYVTQLSRRSKYISKSNSNMCFNTIIFKFNGDRIGIFVATPKTHYRSERYLLTNLSEWLARRITATPPSSTGLHRNQLFG